ncbi:MAG: YqgE/AlgH family protein [Tannerellaceae bacterium]|jgi:putative transcriptional regulator|nr:YqgE/AlgH family protein [Tannerellaceae bacterium]
MEVKNDIFTVRHNSAPLAKGCALIAEPFMKGFCFRRAVVLLAEHSSVSTLGLVLNKPLHIMLNEIYPSMNFAYPLPLFIGGPVQPKRLFFVHTLGDIIPGAKKISDSLYIGGNMHYVFTHLRKREDAIPSVKFFAGYSGWIPNQLKAEVDEDSWLVSRLSVDNIMTANDENFWQSSLAAMGRKYQIWSHYPTTPRLN